MRIYLVLIIALGACFSAFAQKPQCSDFRSGNFTIADTTNGVFIISRKGDVQTEYRKGDTEVYTFKVAWLDECTYTLTADEAFHKKYPAMPANALLTVHIISIKPNSYTQISTSNFSDMKLTSELIRID